MNYFNADAYFQLVSTENDSAILEFIEDTVKTCTSYVQAVDMMETQIRTARFRMEPDEYRELITRLDSRRRTLHNDAISSTSFLNRVANKHGFENIFTGNKEDRNQVADFCMQLTDSIFKRREAKKDAIHSTVQMDSGEEKV